MNIWRYKAILLFAMFSSSTVLGQTDTIINSYAAVIAINSTCSNVLTVDNTAGFNIGDDVLLIQMKGVDVDTSNTSIFGQIVSWNGGGNYELNKVQSLTSTSIMLAYAISGSYNFSYGKAQLVKVPHLQSYAINKVHTAMAWNGLKGGVFAIICDDSLVCNNDINISGKGFKGGQTINPIFHSQFICHQQDYCYPISQYQGAQKGEGIGTVSNNRIFCRGPLYNGGGGGNSTNCGGGGGGNGGTGGLGGNEWNGCTTAQSLGGLGGRTFNYTPAFNKLFLGGGGGAGNTNNGLYGPGGDGGGIALILANKISGKNHSVISDGNQGQDCNIGSGFCDDGLGGGGSGGTILINAQTVTQLNVSVRGGKGASASNSGTNRHGPGGGGGGGVLLTNTGSVLSSINFNFLGGAAGTILNVSTNWGAMPGSNGDTSIGIIAPVDTTSFVANLPTLISDTVVGCQELKFTGSSSIPITLWSWNFGDNSTASGNLITHKYALPGSYAVRLIVSNSICQDTFTKIVTIATPNINLLINDTLISCKTTNFSIINQGNAVTTYAWDFGDGNSGNSAAISHNYIQTGQYIVKLVATDISGCSDSFTKSINIEGIKYDIEDSLLVCLSTYFTAKNKGAISASQFLWMFENGSGSQLGQLKYTFSKSGTYAITLIVIDDKACTDTIQKNISVNAADIPLLVTNDTAICYETRIDLYVSGAKEYTWTPSIEIDKTTGSHVVTTPTKTRTYYVSGTDADGCLGTDSVQINLLGLPKIDITSSYPDVTCDRDAVQLFVSGAESYEWSPAEYFTDNTVNNPIVSPKIGTRFGVLGTDANGCVGSANIPIYVNKEVRIFVPSAFSPNGDGLNDYIKVTPVCYFELKEFCIFNRWGQLLFMTNDANLGWDGRFNGVLQDIDVYFYFAKGIKGDGRVGIIRGDFTLVK